MSDPPLPHLPATPTIELDAVGPRSQRGLLLRAPWHEVLLWDLENEIGSTRRSWTPERDTLWISSSYLPAVIEIVLRSFPSVMLLGTRDGDQLLSRDGVVAVQQRLV